MHGISTAYSGVVAVGHGGPHRGAFSCLEITDVAYFGLMRHNSPTPDTFILSKGHGAMAQYTVLEGRGVLSRDDLEQSGKPGGRLGMQPD